MQSSSRSLDFTHPAPPHCETIHVQPGVESPVAPGYYPTQLRSMVPSQSLVVTVTPARPSGISCFSCGSRHRPAYPPIVPPPSMLQQAQQGIVRWFTG